MSPAPSFGALRGPWVDKDGNLSRDAIRKLQEWEGKLAYTITLVGQIASGAKVQGRTEGIGTTVGQLTPAGQLSNADQIAADGTTFGRVKGTALTANQVDLTKAGVVGPLGSAKMNKNTMLNYSNNATVDSIDNGVNATVRVYGPGGVGTSWHQFIGSVTGPENSSFSGTTAYNQDTYVYFDGSNFFITTVASQTLADGLLWCAFIHTVSAGGGGGVPGGGGSGGGGGGRNTK